jgi:hypothetical protein
VQPIKCFLGPIIDYSGMDRVLRLGHDLVEAVGGVLQRPLAEAFGEVCRGDAGVQARMARADATDWALVYVLVESVCFESGTCRVGLDFLLEGKKDPGRPWASARIAGRSSLTVRGNGWEFGTITADVPFDHDDFDPEEADTPCG